VTTAVFITGSHTDVGKTHVACGVLGAARRRGLTVDALKPVVSGFDFADWAHSDPGRLITAMGLNRSAAALDATSPWIFKAPLAPPMAAALEGQSLAIADIASFCLGRRTTADLFLVEGAGGLMSPLADDGLNIDLIAALDLPVILVGGTYLGAISHTLTALSVLESRGHEIRLVAVSESAAADAPDFAETVRLTARYAGGVPVLPVPRADSDWADTILARLV